VDAVLVEAVKVQQELVGMQRFDREPFAGREREVADVRRDDRVRAVARP
jgi:hypothetical protein